MRRNQRRNQKRKNKRIKTRKVIKNIILILLVSIIIYLIYGFYQESRIRLEEGEYTAEKAEITNNIEEIKKVEKINYNIPKTYLEYEVDCILEIPKIKLKSNVLKEYTKEGLEVCLSKYWGPKPNEIGNYCIAGHNYNQENMFNHLIDLEIGDSMYLTDNQNGKYEYEIYDIYRVKPQNTKPLSQSTQGKREITLITCVNYSRNRLIVKAVEK